MQALTFGWGGPKHPRLRTGRVENSGTFGLQSAFRPQQKKAMRVRVSGKQVQIGETLQVGARARLEDVVGKHFDGGAEANVVFSYNGPFYRADCTLHLDSRTVFKSEGEGQDAHQAFDKACVHMEVQLRRYKRKLKNHHAKVRTRSRVGG
jgi:ribosomal subunit interface protein